jgi:hypothetical protein
VTLLIKDYSMADQTTRNDVRRIIADYIQRHREESLASIAIKFRCSVQSIAGICKEFGISRRPRIGVNNLTAHSGDSIAGRTGAAPVDPLKHRKEDNEWHHNSRQASFTSESPSD